MFSLNNKTCNAILTKVIKKDCIWIWVQMQSLLAEREGFLVFRSLWPRSRNVQAKIEPILQAISLKTERPQAILVGQPVFFELACNLAFIFADILRNKQFRFSFFMGPHAQTFPLSRAAKKPCDLHGHFAGGVLVSLYEYYFANILFNSFSNFALSSGVFAKSCGIPSNL